MDGFIKIGTLIDDSGIDKGIKDIENKINVAEKEKIIIEAKIDAGTTNLTDIRQQIADLEAKAQGLSATFKGTNFWSMSPDQYLALKEYNNLLPKIEELRNRESKINDELAKQEIKRDSLNNKIDAYKNKIAKIEISNFEKQLKNVSGTLQKSVSFAVMLGNALKKGFLKIVNFQKGTNDISKSIGGVISNVKKWGLALIGIRSAYAGIRRLMSTLQTYDKQLSADMSYIGFALANSLKPIIDIIVSGLYKVLSLINQIAVVLTGFNLFKNSGVAQFQKAMASSAGSAKEIKNNLASFDDIEVLKNDDSSGGGGGLKLPSNDLSKDDLFADFMGDAYDLGYMLGQKLTEALENIPWDAIQAKAQELGYNLAMLLNGLVDGIDWNVIGYTIAQGLNTALIFAYTFLTTFDFNKFGIAIGTAINSAVTNINWQLLGATLGAKLEACIDFAYGLLTTVDFYKFGESIAVGVNSWFNTIDWNKLALDFAMGINGIFEAAQGFIDEFDWIGTAITLAEGINTWFDSIDWVGTAQTLSDGISGILDSIIFFLATLDWAGIGASIGDFIANIDWIGIIEKLSIIILELFGGLGEAIITGICEGIGMAMFNIITFINDEVVTPIVNAFKTLFGIHSPSTVMMEIGKNIMLGLFNGISSLVNKILEIWNNLKAFTKAIFTTIQENLYEIADRIRTTVTEVFEGLKNNVVSIFNNIWSTIKNVINSILSGIETMANGIVNGVNKVVDSLNSLSFTIPDWVPGFGGKSWSMNIPKMSPVSLPRLAKGGIIARPTQALIGEAGKEAVLPLENNTEWIDLLTDKLENVMSNWKVEASGDGNWGQFMRFLNLELVKEQNRRGKSFIGGISHG